MKNRFCSSFSKFCFSLLLVSVLAAIALPQTAAPAPANQVTEFEVNGLKVLIKRRPGTPTVAAGLFLRGGVRNMTAENAGIENFMLDVATEGSKSFPRQLLRKELSRTGSTITSGTNYDYSAFSLVSTRQHFESTWKLFTDIVLNPAFAPQDIERVRGRVLTGLRAQSDSPESYLEVLQEKIIYANHPYANDPQGTIDTVSRMAAADLRAYHQKMMQTSRLLLVVVGDVEPEALQKQIAATLGKLPRGDYKVAAFPSLAFSQPTVDVASRSLQTNYVKGVFAAPPIGDPDYYAMRVAIAILQQQVFQEVRVKRNLSYAPGADMGGFAANTANISVSSVNPNEAIKVMLDTIDGLKKSTVNQSMILEMGGFFLTTYYLRQETNAAQAGELASYELNGGGWRTSLGFLDKMREVTPDDVRRVVNKYMKNIRFIVVGNPADVDKQVFLKQGAE